MLHLTVVSATKNLKGASTNMLNSLTQVVLLSGSRLQSPNHGWPKIETSAQAEDLSNMTY